ncbi:hypothetical protein BVRB_9g222020 [Beta vulgaris subsp. vulgaris]|nr:hypothetical protein BVRB_9g222020 [Beta vulgaris subsp. vulgaris]
MKHKTISYFTWHQELKCFYYSYFRRVLQLRLLHHLSLPAQAQIKVQAQVKQMISPSKDADSSSAFS